MTITFCTQLESKRANSEPEEMEEGEEPALLEQKQQHHQSHLDQTFDLQSAVAASTATEKRVANVDGVEDVEALKSEVQRLKEKLKVRRLGCVNSLYGQREQRCVIKQLI